jgi:hypothetical protein
MNPGLTKNYNAGAAVLKRRFIKFGADDKTVLQAAAATDLIVGASTDVDTVTGETTDVIVSGIALLQAGGAVTRGQEVTSDANGKAVAAAPGAGVNNRVGGIAMASAVLDDWFPVLIAPSVKQG